MIDSLTKHEVYIKRCFNLAKRAGRMVGKNPMVGAVLVFKDQIIGEGYHKAYGGHHAEVNAVNSVNDDDRSLIKEATLYVSLEPCCIHSKTPACTNLILKHGIKKVVVSTLDPNPLVAGNGVNILKENGIEVIEGILEKEGKKLIKSFHTHVLLKRPYVILKFAQSYDGFISKKGETTQISSKESQVLNHKWRSEVDGILVGTQTAIIDNPKLTNRAYPGNNPARLVIDRQERIPKSNHLLSDENSTIIFTEVLDYEANNVSSKEIIQLTSENQLGCILDECFQRNINLLIVEGGKKLIESFVKSGMWDECRIIKSKKILGGGVSAPLIHMSLEKQYSVGEDQIYFGYKPE